MKPGPKPKIAPETKLFIADMYNSGAKIIDIAKQIHMSQKSVSQIVYQLGISRKRFCNGDRNKQIADLSKAGMSNKDIAIKMGLCSSTISNILTKQNIWHNNKGFFNAKAEQDLLIPPIPQKPKPKPPERIYDRERKKWYVDVPIETFFIN